MRFRKVHFCSGFLLALVCAAAALAQNATGSITGTVKDPNNEVIANAVVTVTNEALSLPRWFEARTRWTPSTTPTPA